MATATLVEHSGYMIPERPTLLQKVTGSMGPGGGGVRGVRGGRCDNCDRGDRRSRGDHGDIGEGKSDVRGRMCMDLLSKPPDPT